MTVTFREAKATDEYYNGNDNKEPRIIPAMTVDTRDDAHRQVQQKISLNRFDAKFMMDIYLKYITRNRPLSVGQNELWEKIVHKYRKQLKKRTDVDYKKLFTLEWKAGIWTEDDLRSQTFFRIVRGEEGPEMVMRFNFSKDMITEIRTLVHDDAKQYIKKSVSQDSWSEPTKYKFFWDNEKRVWTGPFQLHLFRHLYDYAKKHKIIIDKSVTSLIDQLNDRYGSAESWRVGLVEVNGRMYINNASDQLINALADVDLDNMTLDQMSEFCSEYAVEPPLGFSTNQRQLLKQNRYSEKPYEVENIVDWYDLKNYITAIGGKALFHLAPMPNIDGVEIVDSVATVSNDIAPHALTGLLDARTIEYITDGSIDILVSTVPFTALVAQHRVLTDSKIIKKVIHIKFPDESVNIIN